ncbi:hypothetical protein GE21DRAFT_2846 [Neurospora crassa]|uniref:DUF2470 domain-containing protein n=2 Tax=Neurospora crassa TaxID=5141 RepID=Q1K5F3_NEUCR|nr:hypothetical protein NCU03410 [Neurospora crassa OR74A]EAA27621.1 hypothetical protein NCU03410 [Neurospora crassa OR74A]KHE86397.1 hypothetical protein GE21DRAFT_2846 [Neurospora crassa]CAD21123.1 hypothetical protein [Neurospora crassa]|eukprot:XP_956857.1 hypothetical protein NCU03410 [Neurospora crassa OR74A]
MATPTPTTTNNNKDGIDPTSLARTIAHMNKDHATDLLHMLIHYSPLALLQLPLDLEKPVRQLVRDLRGEDVDLRLVDMSLAELKVQTRAKEGAFQTRTTIAHTIPIHPPMKSWAERRERLVAMTKEAREGLGLPVEGVASEEEGKKKEQEKVGKREKKGGGGAVIDTYLAPRLFWDGAVAISVAFFFGCYAAVKGGYVEQGLWAWEFTQKWWPVGGADGFKWLVNAMFWPVLGIHIAEMVMFERTRLAKNDKILMGGLTWLKWMVSVFFEGYMAFRRYDEKAAELERKQH